MATQLSNPSFAQQNTVGTNDLGPDGYSWAAAHPLVADKFGKLIAIVSRQNAGTVAMLFVVSNDSGATWTDPTRTSFAAAAGEIAITRGALAYDSVNDLCHVLWNGTAATDGIIYRRYTITRDGSNNITGFTRDTNVNLQLDFQTTGTMQYEHPNLIWMTEPSAGGQLLAVWGARNSANATLKTEIRASMRVLSNSAADGTAGNWAAPVTASTTGIGNAPNVAYSILDTANVGSIMYPAIKRKTTGTFAKDVYVGYHDGNVSVNGGAWKCLRMRWASATNNWATGVATAVTLSNLLVAGTDTGYSLKYQLMSQISEDTTSGRMILGYAVWLSNVSGDTWSFSTIDDATDNPSSRVDVYSAGGAHTYAPVGDLFYDATSDRTIVSYQKQDTFAYLKSYNNTTVDQAETVIYNGSRVDIPLLYAPRVSGKLIIYFRDSVNTPTPPYHGYAGTMTWAASGPSGASRKGYAYNPAFVASGVC